jgi:3-methyladenine DNA glycosylase AlkD
MGVTEYNQAIALSCLRVKLRVGEWQRGMDWLRKILQEFRDHQNPAQAVPMAKYMQNRFAFLGLARPERDRLQNEFIKAARRENQIDWDLVRQCWDLPEREYQYLAVDYLIANRKNLQPEDMLRLGQMITSRSWWDSVDTIAVKLVGELCAQYPDLVEKHILRWATADDIWLRRTAILFQLKYKGETDSHRLGRIIIQNLGSQQFFINKAIGWALREYSKTNPDWVKDFMAAHQLHPLSVREGSKYL